MISKYRKYTAFADPWDHHLYSLMIQPFKGNNIVKPEALEKNLLYLSCVIICNKGVTSNEKIHQRDHLWKSGSERNPY